MHSTFVRIQNVFGFFTTVAFVLAALIALSVITVPQTPSAAVKLSNVQVVKGRPHYYSYKKEEYAHIKFDLDADLSSLFNWNTKQVFVWVSAKWPPAPSTHKETSSSSSPKPPNEAVVWDTIISADATPWSSFPAALRKPSSPKSKAKQAKKSTAKKGVLRLRKQKSKYQITDVAGKLAGQGNVTLELGWNVQPWVGGLAWTSRVAFGNWAKLKGGVSEDFDFPLLKPKTA